MKYLGTHLTKEIKNNKTLLKQIKDLNKEKDALY